MDIKTICLDDLKGKPFKILIACKKDEEMTYLYVTDSTGNILTTNDIHLYQVDLSNVDLENTTPKPIRSKFSNRQQKAIVEKYQKGFSMAELSRLYNCQPKTIRNVLKLHSIPIKNPQK